MLDVVRHVTECQVSWRECVRCSETFDCVCQVSWRGCV